MPRYKAIGQIPVVRDGVFMYVPLGEDVPEAQEWAEPGLRAAINAGRLVAIPENPDGSGDDAVIAKLSADLRAAEAEIRSLRADVAKLASPAKAGRV